MANDKLQYTIEAVDNASKTFDKVSATLEKTRLQAEKFRLQNEKLGLQNEKLIVQNEKLRAHNERAAQSLEKYNKNSGALTTSFIKAEVAVAALKTGFGFLTGQYQESINLANEYQRAVTGLSSTAGAFGVSQDAARAAAQRLTNDGLLSVADASKSLQNLLTTGIGLDKAEQLMNAYKSQAALGRANSMSFSQAVANLSESFLTESSAIGNLAGQSENYNQILDRGAAIMGKSVSSMTDAERQMAKYIGTMELGKVTAVDLELYLGTADAQMQIFANTVDRLQIMFGQALSPAVMYAVQSLSEMVIGVNSGASPALQTLAKTLVYLVGLARVTGKIFIEMGQAIANSLKGPQIMLDKAMKGDFLGAITEPWTNTFNSFKDAAVDVGAEVDKVSQDLSRINGKIDTQGLGAFGNVFREKAKFAASEVGKAGQEIGNKLKKIGEDIGKEMENYARTSADKIRTFNDSMQSLVLQHRNAIRDLRSQMGELNDEFNNATKERSDEHSTKKSEINQKYEDETRTLKDNLARRLTDSKGSDEQIIAFFQAQLAEKQRIRDEELRKEDEQFAKEEARQQASHAKQLTALQTKLNAELEIERKHRAEFEQFKNVVEEDDITRLKNGFEREMAELRRQHDDRMMELRKQQEEILALKATASSSAAKAIQQSSQSRTSSSKPVVYGPPKPANLTKYHDGGVIPGSGEVPILAKGGETVMTQQQTQGLMELLKNLGAGIQGGVGGIQMTNHIYDKFDFVGAMREAGWRARIR